MKSKILFTFGELPEQLSCYKTKFLKLLCKAKRVEITEIENVFMEGASGLEKFVIITLNPKYLEKLAIFFEFFKKRHLYKKRKSIKLNSSNLKYYKVLNNKKQNNSIKNIKCNKVIKSKKQINNTKIINLLEYTHLNNNEFKQLFIDWLEVRRKMRAPNTRRALQLNLNKLKHCTLDQAILTVEKSIAHGWRGLFPPMYNIEGVNRVNELVRKTLKQIH